MNPQQILLLLEWYDYRIHKGVGNIAKKEGWLLYCPSKTTADSIEILESWNGDGCIALFANQDTISYFSKEKINLPTIDIGLSDHGIKLNRVVTDNKEVMRLAVNHIIDQGYKEIFTVSPGDNKMCVERFTYLQEFMKQKKGKVHVLKNAQHSHSNFHIQISDNIIKELEEIAKARNLIDINQLSIAFFAYDDVMAAQMIRTLRQYDVRIPESVAVLGVDNDELVNCALNIELSSVDCDLEGLGEKAAVELKKVLDDPKYADGKIVRHKPRKLVPRRSTDTYAVNSNIVSLALRWINENFQTGILASDVAEHLNITQQGLQKAFQDHYIRTPGQEIRHQRTIAVANLLECTNASLDEIAKNCGYYSVDTLINGFKEKYKMTPGKYRRLTKKLSS